MSLEYYRMLMSPIRMEEVTDDILYFVSDVDTRGFVDVVTYSANYGGKSVTFNHGQCSEFYILDNIARINDGYRSYSAQSIVKILSKRDKNLNSSQIWHPSLISPNISLDTTESLGIALIILYGHMISGELPEDQHIKKIIHSKSLKNVDINLVKSLLEKIP